MARVLLSPILFTEAEAYYIIINVCSSFGAVRILLSLIVCLAKRDALELWQSGASFEAEVIVGSSLQ